MYFLQIKANYQSYVNVKYFKEQHVGKIRAQTCDLKKQMKSMSSAIFP